MSATSSRFEMRGIRKCFGATVALDDVDLAVEPGEVCALVGENGAGKSTLMGVLSGALQPDAGAMSLDGAPYRPGSPLDARRSGVAMIYQELSLAPHLSGHGEHRARHGADHPRHRPALRDAAHGPRTPWRSSGTTEIRGEAPVGDLVAGGAAGGGDRPRPRHRLPRPRPRRADEQPGSRRRRRGCSRLIGRLKAQGQAIVYISHFIEEVQAK